MNTLGKIVSGISSLFEFNKATLSGALDVIVVESDNSFMVCNPFRVRFGKLKVLKSQSRNISITVNGVQSAIYMKLSPAGEGYFPVHDGLSPGLEEKKNISEQSSPSLPEWPSDNSYESLGELNRNKPQQILPKQGDYCDDLIAGDEECDPEAEEREMIVEMSLCASLWDQSDDNEKIFNSKLVPYEEFQRNPWGIINNPNLLIKLDHKVYTKDAALPMILSLIIYKQPLTPIIKPEKTAFNLSPDSRIKPSYFTLSSDQLKSLNLKLGKNDVLYSVNTPLQGVQQIEGRIYLWKANSKIIISDIDGTITKSDVLGHLFTMIGKDWSHIGVAKLYDLIVKNGYKIMYLSSRAIGQANFTRDFLFSLKQDGVELPDGPLIISPDRLLKSFLREVVDKTPQKFKTSALCEIAGLFPLEMSPFYAGFGNRDTDAIAYRAAGVALDKIFVINPQGRIFVFNDNIYLESYTHMTEFINEIFPHLNLII